jgi:hypothetical protein
MSATNTGWRLMILDAPQVNLSLEMSPILMELVSPGPQGASAAGGGNVNVVSGDGITVTESPADTFTVRANFGSAGNTVCQGNDARLSDARTPTAHGHAISDVSGLQTALDAKAAASHSHAIADVTGLQTALDGKAASSHAHAVADVTGLQTALDGKSNVGHGHAISDVSGLQTALDGKASTSHTHAISDVSGLQTALDAKLDDSQATATGLSVLGAATAAAGATALGLGTGDTPTFKEIVLENGERIRNTTNGRVEILPQPSVADRIGITFDLTLRQNLISIGSFRPIDSAVNVGGVYWDIPLQVGNNVDLVVSGQDWSAFRQVVGAGLRQTLCVGVGVGYNFGGTDISSSSFALMHRYHFGLSTRCPSVTHADPTFYVYSMDSTQANDFVRMSHDQTDGVIESGNGDLRLVAPGEIRFNGNLIQSRITSAQSRLLGRGGSSGAGQPQEITIGSGLSLTGTTLSATGGGGGVSKSFAIAMAVAL